MILIMVQTYWQYGKEATPVSQLSTIGCRFMKQAPEKEKTITQIV